MTGRTPQPAQMDRLTIAQLAAVGANLAAPTSLTAFLYVPSVAEAKLAAVALQPQGYTVRVCAPEPPTGTPWLVEATIMMAPSVANVAAMRHLFEGLARRYGGDYDGWEAAVAR